MSTAVWAVLGVIGLAVLAALAIALWAIGAYNNFVRLKNLVSAETRFFKRTKLL